MPNILKHLARILIRGRDEGPRTQAQRRANDLDVAVLDMEVFRELHATLGSDVERVRGVYAKFLESTAARIDELRHQPVAASLKTLHALKGSAGMVGASRLEILAARLQDAATEQHGAPGAVESGAIEAGVIEAGAINDVESELAAFRGVLESELDSVTHPR